MIHLLLLCIFIHKKEICRSTVYNSLHTSRLQDLLLSSFCFFLFKCRNLICLFSLALILQFLYHIRTHTERCVYTYLLYMHCVTYFDALQRNQFWYSHNSCPTWKDFWCAAPLPADKTATLGQEKGKKGQEKRIRKQELHHNIHTSIVCDKTLLY